MKVAGAFYFDKQDAGKAIIAACKSMQSPDPISLGEYRGFKQNYSSILSREIMLSKSKEKQVIT